MIKPFYSTCQQERNIRAFNCIHTVFVTCWSLCGNPRDTPPRDEVQTPVCKNTNISILIRGIFNSIIDFRISLEAHIINDYVHIMVGRKTNKKYRNYRSCQVSRLHQDNRSVSFIPPCIPLLYSKTGIYRGKEPPPTIYVKKSIRIFHLKLGIFTAVKY